MDANSTRNDIKFIVQLPNLKPYQYYTVTARAVNQIGLGERTSVTFQTDMPGIVSYVAQFRLSVMDYRIYITLQYVTQICAYGA